jgi:hypothetical protein
MSDSYLLDKYNKNKIINEYYEDILGKKLKLRKININKILWNKRMGILKDNNNQNNFAEKRYRFK